MTTEDPIRLEHVLTGAFDPSFGGVVVFAGVIREESGGRRVTRMFYDCYREMAERTMRDIIEDARGEKTLGAVRVLHRVGDVPAGEVSLVVVVSAPHRREAFEACEWIVGELKRRVPIWKKEHYDDGTSRWL